MSGFETDEITGRSTVYPDDCDHMGHMNVASYTRKFDEATWAFWSSVGMSFKAMDEAGIGLAAMESNVTYRKELFPGESFLVRSRFVWMREKVARFHHRMYALHDDGEGLTETLAATCTYTVACLNRSAHKAQPWPAGVVERVTPRLKPMDEG